MDATKRTWAAAVLPRNGKFILWVESPSGQYMLLSGHWLTQIGASRYARKAGFVITNDPGEVLTLIEQQLEKRLSEL